LEVGMAAEFPVPYQKEKGLLREGQKGFVLGRQTNLERSKELVKEQAKGEAGKSSC